MSKGINFELTSTVEELNASVSPGYGGVSIFDEYAIAVDLSRTGAYITAIYKFTGTPEEIAENEMECPLELIEEADLAFKDSGHAVQWALHRITNRFS